MRTKGTKGTKATKVAFRQVDARYPFLWESADQPAGRWHAAGDGPAHYFADTPAGAWAEFLRHEEISDPADLVTIRRQMWAVEIGDEPAVRITRLRHAVLTGGLDTYAACQREARRLRDAGIRRIVAPSAALKPGAAHGYFVDDGVWPAKPRDGLTVVLFDAPRGLVGWVAAEAARPGDDVLGGVRHYSALGRHAV